MKFKLNLDDLRVESFETGERPANADGTVFAYFTGDQSLDCGCPTDTCGDGGGCQSNPACGGTHTVSGCYQCTV